MSKKAAKAAYDKGYRVAPDGKVYHQSGREVRPHIDTGGYLRMTINDNGKRTNFGVHRLVAYQKFGEEYMKDGIMARHLDSNKHNNRHDNIAIGTHSDNSMDMPAQQRRELAATGRRKYTEAEIESWRKMNAEGIPFRKIEAITGVRRSMLSYYLSRKAKATSFSVPMPPKDEI